MAQDVAALKAVSQNLMHENLTVTDGIYGVLSDVDVKNQIGMLGVTRGVREDESLEELRSLLRELTARLR